MQKVVHFCLLFVLVVPTSVYSRLWRDNDWYNSALSGDMELSSSEYDGSGSGEDVTSSGDVTGSGEDMTSSGDVPGSGEDMTSSGDGSGSGEDVNSSDDISGSVEGVTASDDISGSDEGDTVSGEGSGSGEGDTVSGEGSGSGELASTEDEMLILDGDEVVLSSSGEESVGMENTLLSQPEFQETIIFLHKTPTTDSLLYIRGGNPSANVCTDDSAAEKDACAIPIKNMFLGLNTYSYERDRQSQGDNFLSWLHRETHQVQEAKGTPAMVTTNIAGYSHFSDFNTFGSNYWMVRFQMDCSRTANGYFEVKGYYEGQEEPDIANSACTGSAGETPLLPVQRGGHLARCGFLNTFSWGSSDCHVQNIVQQ